MLRLQLHLSADDVDPGRDTAVFKVCGAIVYCLGSVQLRTCGLNSARTSDGFEVKVVDNILWVRSEANMVGYLNAPSPFDRDGWLCTGDMVETDPAASSDRELAVGLTFLILQPITSVLEAFRSALARSGRRWRIPVGAGAFRSALARSGRRWRHGASAAGTASSIRPAGAPSSNNAPRRSATCTSCSLGRAARFRSDWPTP